MIMPEWTTTVNVTASFNSKYPTKVWRHRVECIFRNAPLDPNVGRPTNLVSIWWCAVLENIFQDQKRVLPYNVSFMFSGGDRWYPNRPGFCCLGSSSEGGIHSITNFLEIKRMQMNKTYPITTLEQSFSCAHLARNTMVRILVRITPSTGTVAIWLPTNKF